MNGGGDRHRGGARRRSPTPSSQPAAASARPGHAVGTLPPLSPPPSRDVERRDGTRIRRTQGPWMSVSSMTSRGRSQPTSSPSRSSAEPAFDGPLDELDRRSGGELRALAAFRELSGKRYSTSLAATGELPASRLVTVGIGDAGDARSRDGAAHRRHGASGASAAATVERAGDLARRRSSTPSTASRRDRRRARRARRRRGRLRPRDHLPRERRDVAAGARRADPRRARARTPRRSTEAAERGVIIGEGANIARDALEPRLERRQPGGPRRRGAGDRRAARPVDRRHRARSGRPSSAWACSWPSAGAATTRRG